MSDSDHEAIMQLPLYVALSSQIALQKRLDTIGANIANASTTGHRADSVSFASLVSSRRTGSVAFVDQGDLTIDRRSGALQQTGNALDVAIEGDAWFALQTPAGIAYSRDGRLSMSSDGRLLSATGHPVLDAGNAPIQIDPNGGSPTIARDGMISQGGKKLAAIGVFHIPAEQALTRFGDSAFLGSKEAEPMLDFHSVNVAQGYLEQSNVNTTTEMMNLITVSRAFQGAATVIDDTERKLDDAIRTLGATGR